MADSQDRHHNGDTQCRQQVTRYNYNQTTYFPLVMKLELFMEPLSQCKNNIKLKEIIIEMCQII